LNKTLELNAHTFHIDAYSLALLGTVFTGLNFALLLGLTKRGNRAANRCLALALAVMVLWLVHISAIGIRLPLQLLLALGPLIYFYVLKLTRPQYKFSGKDLLHFIPVLPEQLILPNTALQLLTFISVITYLFYAHKLIKRYYRRMEFIEGDRHRYQLRWLQKLLTGFALLWLLWIPFAAADYFYHHHQLGMQVEDPFFLCITAMLTGIAATAYLRLEVGMPANVPLFLKPLPRAELKGKGVWLKNVMKTKRYYQDPELSLSSLAEKLN
jgi:putative ABC transport system permease protein